jgi:hypothetical protein
VPDRDLDDGQTKRPDVGRDGVGTEVALGFALNALWLERHYRTSRLYQYAAYRHITLAAYVGLGKRFF